MYCDSTVYSRTEASCICVSGLICRPNSRSGQQQARSGSQQQLDLAVMQVLYQRGGRQMRLVYEQWEFKLQTVSLAEAPVRLDSAVWQHPTHLSTALVIQVSLQWSQEDSAGQDQLLAIVSAVATERHSNSAPGVSILQYLTERRRILQARLATHQHVSSRMRHLQCTSYVEKLLGTALGFAGGAVASVPAASETTATQQQGSMQRRTRHGRQLQTIQQQLSEWRRQMNDPVQTIISVLTTGKVGREDLPPHWQPVLRVLQQQLHKDQDQQGLMQQSIQELNDVLQKLQQQVGCELVHVAADSASRPAQTCGLLQEQTLTHAAAVDVPAAASGVRTASDAAAVGSDGVRNSAAAITPAVQAGATAAGLVASAISAIEAAVRTQLDATEAQCCALEERCRGKDAEVAALKALVLGLQQQLARRHDAAAQGSN